ncbi:MAG: AAA family ATPase [Deltaproteobacteria bacterium]|nr:AAA family ATPase [Myxococcales bacterium]MDP3219084.1 AAA family ATPase [Deltaproteobacteria bacterium]
MLRWLKINRYRNVVPGTELTFSDGHHVLLGPNGGGKTTLLELIAAVLRGDFSGMADEEFSFEYQITDGVEATMLLELEHVLEASQDASTPAWRDTLTATLTHPSLGTRKLKLADHKVAIDGVEMPSHGVDMRASNLHTMLSLNCWDDRPADNPPPYFSWLGAFRFDEALSFFSFLRGMETLGGRAYVSIYRPLPGGTLRLSYLRHPLFDSVCKAIIDVLRTPEEDTDRVTIPFSSLGSFGDAVELLGFSSAALRAELERQVRTRDQERLTYERFQFRFVRRDGTMVLDEHLSFGQKRLLAFLFYAWANDGPIVADELVDGMHYRWIEHCLKTIRGRQAFLSSQNPLLMDFIGFDSAEKVQQTFVICDVEESDGRERMRWRNLTADEAGDFFDAYEVGIQHVSEILRDKGLW